MSNTRFYILSLISVLIFGALLSLGNWQLERLTEKEELLRTIDTRMRHIPLTLQDYTNAHLGEDYWPIIISGVFHHESERHVFNIHQGQSGYFIYTPLEIAPLEFTFVNRGFVPFDKKDPKTRMGGQTSGVVTITGLTRSIPSTSQIKALPNNDVKNNIFYSKDFKMMETSANLPQNAVLHEMFVEADKINTPAFGMPKGGVTYINFPNNHMQYAITWFGLAAALASVWMGVTWKHYHRNIKEYA